MTASIPHRDLLNRLRGEQETMLSELRELVQCESPSADAEATARCADLFASMAGPYLGSDADRIEVDSRTVLRWRFGPTGRPTQVLLLGHLDTVWPVGSLEIHPAGLNDGLFRGPGCFDMKAGLIQMLHALAAVGDLGGVSLLVTSDEEIGSPTSRSLIEAEAIGAVAALVAEPSAGAALKHGRKGVSMYEVDLTGREAHAGLEPEKGINAAVELGHQILAVIELADPEAGTTVTPTVASAGTTTNTVPRHARLSVDVRAATAEEQERIDTGIHSLRPALEGAEVRVIGGPNRPPLDPSMSSELVTLAQQESIRLGLGELHSVTVGGGSDGNFTAGVGTPTLDGLGAVGGGAHAADEHVVVDAMPERAALLAAIVRELLGRGEKRRTGGPAEREPDR